VTWSYESRPTGEARLLVIAQLLRMGYAPAAVSEAVKLADKGQLAEAIARLTQPEDAA
jgi:hypothetical protein